MPVTAMHPELYQKADFYSSSSVIFVFKSIVLDLISNMSSVTCLMIDVVSNISRHL